MKVKILKKCYDQDGRRWLLPGEIVGNLSDFERGRHLAEGAAVVHDKEIETAITDPPEKAVRRRGRRKKSDNGL